jgi:hypothetical protein
VQMPNDPGPTIQLQVVPAGAIAPAAPAPATPVPRVMSQVEPQVIVQEPVYNATVITSGTVYQPYVVAAPYYYPGPVFGTSLIIRGGSGYGHRHNGYYGHGHGRW